MRDRRRGYVKVFSGVLTEAALLQTADAMDPTQHRLLTANLLSLDDTRTQTLEMLPISRHVWLANGERTTRRIIAQWKEVAKPPEAIPTGLSPDRTPIPSHRQGGRRRMSEREQRELFREARRHWLSPAVAAFALSALLIGLVIEALTSRFSLKALQKWGGEVHIIWFALAADAFFVRRWREARLLFQDAHQGEIEFTAIGAEKAGADTSWRESLPISGRPWSEAGKPAAWRQMR